MKEVAQIKVANHVEVFDELRALHSMGLSEMSKEEWKWKHLDNPFAEGEPELIVAIDGDTIIGATCYMPFRFIVAGREIRAIQPCDSVVHPAHRGKGILSRILAYGDSHYQERGYPFGFGFPNEKALPGFLKQGWNLVMAIRQLNYFINWARVVQCLGPKLPLQGAASWVCDKVLIRRRRKDRFAGNTVVSVFDSFPDAMSQLDDLYNAQTLEMMRSREYMAWRLDRHPRCSFHYIVGTDRKVLLWYAVVDVIKDGHGLRTGRIVDYKVRNESTQLFENAISASVDVLDGKKCDRIIMLRPTHANLRNVPGKLGFATTLESLAHEVNTMRGKRPVSLIVKPLATADSSMNVLDGSRWAPTSLYHDALFS